MRDDLPSTEKALSRLKRVALSLAIDDFGTGWSSPAPSSRSTCARWPKASTPARVEA